MLIKSLSVVSIANEQTLANKQLKKKYLQIESLHEDLR